MVKDKKEYHYTIRVDDETLRRINYMKAAHNLSTSEVIRRAIDILYNDHRYGNIINDDGDKKEHYCTFRLDDEINHHYRWLVDSLHSSNSEIVRYAISWLVQ